MKRPALIGFSVLAIGLVIWWLNETPSARLPGEPSRNGESQPAAESHSPGAFATNAALPEPSGRAPVPLLGETILAGYGSASLPPENDLTLMSRLMGNSLLLLKSAADRPLSANEDWADLLRGRNGAQERFLPEQHAALNARGQLIDRWQTPLFFHAEGGGRWSVRSAGPDRKLWTGDDLHRNSDGSFRRGDRLNPPALWPDAGQNR